MIIMMINSITFYSEMMYLMIFINFCQRATVWAKQQKEEFDRWCKLYDLCDDNDINDEIK